MGRLTEFYESLTLFYTKNKFQNPQISRKTLRLSPERSTLGRARPAGLGGDST
jgi:hypothetical protein